MKPILEAVKEHGARPVAEAIFDLMNEAFDGYAQPKQKGKFVARSPEHVKAIAVANKLKNNVHPRHHDEIHKHVNAFINGGSHQEMKKKLAKVWHAHAASTGLPQAQKAAHDLKSKIDKSLHPQVHNAIKDFKASGNKARFDFHLKRIQKAHDDLAAKNAPPPAKAAGTVSKAVAAKFRKAAIDDRRNKRRQHGRQMRSGHLASKMVKAIPDNHPFKEAAAKLYRKHFVNGDGDHKEFKKAFNAERKLHPEYEEKKAAPNKYAHLPPHFQALMHHLDKRIEGVQAKKAASPTKKASISAKHVAGLIHAKYQLKKKLGEQGARLAMAGKKPVQKSSLVDKLRGHVKRIFGKKA